MHGGAVRTTGGQPCGLQRRQLADAVGQVQGDAAFGLIEQLRAPVRMPIGGVRPGVDGQAHHRAGGGVRIGHGVG
ncbi:hypothetical protein D9M72_413450 [compost metagenome]